MMGRLYDVSAHPRDVPVSKTFVLNDVADANRAVDAMIKTGFAGRKTGFRVLMPKDKKTAKRIGFAVTTGISTGLRQRGHPRDIKYWTYHHDKDHYAIVLLDSRAAGALGL